MKENQTKNGGKPTLELCSLFEQRCMFFCGKSGTYLCLKLTHKSIYSKFSKKHTVSWRIFNERLHFQCSLAYNIYGGGGGGGGARTEVNQYMYTGT